MATKINISIPKPCHENWQEMTIVDKNRFCDSCQKSVFDFTTSTDREIINAFENNHSLCGRFLNTQLNRDLIKPKEKSSIWLATSASLVSFIGLGTHEITAQEPVKTEQTDKKVNAKDSKSNSNQEIVITGVVTDSIGALPGANVVIKGTKIGTQTDFDGNFKIKAKIGQTLEFSFIGYQNLYFVIEEKSIVNNVKMNFDETVELTSGIVITTFTKKRTFFGRTFHSIKNWFK